MTRDDDNESNDPLSCQFTALRVDPSCSTTERTALPIGADLPIEILRAILKQTCGVPEAFEYPILEPELYEEHVSELVKESMLTKLSLSRVSRLFHTVMDEYLYEIIKVRYVRRVRRLVRTLRAASGANTKGWWCRRLEVDVRLNTRWAWGCISLWGLVTACPRLVDLRCSVVCASRSIMRRVPAPTYPVSLPLSQMIASQSSLRHLMFGGAVTLTPSIAIRLLAHLSLLEVCRFSRLQPRPDADMKIGADSDAEEGEEYAPTRPLRSCTRGDEYQEYVRAAQDAHWPYPTRRSVELPRLRDLRITSSVSMIDGWKLPSLQSVSDGERSSWSTGPEHVIRTLRKALQPHTHTLLQFTFQGFSWSRVWELVGGLRALQHLRFHLKSLCVSDGILPAPHLALRTVTLFRGLGSREWTCAAMDNIIRNVEEEKLPVLSVVKVWGHDGSGYAPRYDQRRAVCEQLGLSVDIREIECIH